MKIFHNCFSLCLLVIALCWSCKEDNKDIIPVKITKDNFEVKLIQISRKESAPGEQLQLLFQVANNSSQDYRKETKASTKSYRCRFNITFTDGSTYQTSMTEIPYIAAHASSGTLKIAIDNMGKTYKSHSFEITE